MTQNEHDLFAMYKVLSDEDKKGVFDYLRFKYEQTLGAEKGVEKKLLNTSGVT